MSVTCTVEDACGGCPLLSRSSEIQRTVKIDRLRACLAEARVAFERAIDWVESPHATGYRNRIRLRVDGDGLPAFFNAHKSARCVVVQPSVLETIEALRKVASKHPALLTSVAHLEVRGRDSDGVASIHLHFAGAPRPNCVGMLREQLRPHLVGYTGMPAADHPHQRYELMRGIYACVPLGSFLQVHDAVNRALVRHVVEGAARRSVGTFFDLYCGSGNFALPLAAGGRRGRCVEQDPLAVAKLRWAAKSQGIPGLQAHAGDTVGHATAWAAAGEGADLVVVDPPRAGVRRGLTDIASMAREWLAMCSCNPGTLVRDLAHLLSLGFTIDRVTAFDMFPHTGHLETVVWLRRARELGGDTMPP